MAQHAGKSFNGLLPPLIWLIAAGSVVMLYVQRGRSIAVTGLAVSQAHTVAPAVDGAVRRLPVELYQPVFKGDILAVIDYGATPDSHYQSALIAARQETARAELKRLQAELDAAREQIDMESDRLTTEQDRYSLQLALEVEKGRLEALKLKTELEPGRVEMEALRLDKTILEQLAAKQAVEQYEVDKAAALYEMVASRVLRQEDTLTQLEANLETARQRLAQQAPRDDRVRRARTLLEPFARAIDVQNCILGELFLPVNDIVLRAPFDGVVSTLLCSEGQGVVAGQPILTLYQHRAESVVVWMPAGQTGLLTEDQPVELVRGTPPTLSFKTQVAAVSPALELLPEQMWKIPNTPQWGQPARILIPDGINLFTNEKMGVRILPTTALQHP